MKHWLKALALAALFTSLLAQATTPTVAERATSKVTSNGTSHAVTLPVTGIAAGDMLIAAISWDCTGGTATLTGWPAGWTLVDEQRHSSGAYATSIYYKIATGSETSPMTLTTSASDQSVHRVWRISAGTFDPAIAPGFASNLVQSNLAPDPPSLTPAGGSKTYLWLALASVNEGNSTGTATVTGFPASYTDTGTDLSSVSNGAVALGWAEFASTATSENPGAFALFGVIAENNDSYTVSIAPVVPATFTSGPALGTPTATSLPTTFTTDQSGNVEAVACPDGQTPPTQVQTFAHNCTGDIAAAAFFTEAVTAGVADGHTFTGLVHSTIYDLYFGIDATLDSTAVSTIANATTICGSTPSVSSVDADDSFDAADASIAIAGSNLCNTHATATVVLRDGSANDKTLACSVFTNTSWTCAASGVGMGVVNGLKYGALTLRFINDAGNLGTKAVTVTAPSGTLVSTLSGGVAPLAFDDFDNPNRPYGDPLDLQTTSDVGRRNAVGCLISEITVNTNGLLVLDPDCTAFDWDFTRDGLYLGTVGTIQLSGCAPAFGGTHDQLLNLVFQKNVAIVPIDFSTYFTACDEAITNYTLQLLGAAVDSTTDVDGAVVASAILVVDDASVLLDNIGDYIQFGSGSMVRLRWANPQTNEIKVSAEVTVADNTQVNIRTTSPTTITGLTLNAGTGILSGTPTSAAVSGPLVIRAATASGLTADTP